MTLEDRLREIREKTLARMRQQEPEEDRKNTAVSEAEKIETLPAAEEQASATVETQEPEEALAAPSELEQLKAEFAALTAERDQLVDRLARLQAEFENARKREQRERIEFRDYATGNVVESFLPVLDNFSLALKADGSIEQLRQGVELIVKQMEEVLRQLNVVPVEAVGAQFDPRVHEALGTEERADVPDHQVIDEIRRGYRIRERLLRPAMVRVASNKQQTEA